MRISNSGDIALMVPDMVKTVDFFKSILNFKVEKLSSHTYKVFTDKFNLYITQKDEFSVLMEFLVEDVNKAKEKCLQNGCSVLKWEGGDKWLQHESGFSFNLGVLSK